MNTSVMGLRVSSVIFGLVGLAHLVRLLMQLEVVIAGRHMPVWMSGAAVIVSAILCVWLWRLSLPVKAPETHSDAATPHAPPTAAS